MTIEADKLYVPKEVAEFLRCGNSSVYALASAGVLASIRVGARNGGLRFRGSDLLSFVAKRRVEVEPRKRFTRLGL